MTSASYIYIPQRHYQFTGMSMDTGNSNNQAQGRRRRGMRLAAAVLALLLAGAALAQRPLPLLRIIERQAVEPVHGNLGDVNRDGYDDWGLVYGIDYRRLHVYFGGEEMSPEPGIVLPAPGDFARFTCDPWLIGRFSNRSPNCFMVMTFYYRDDQVYRLDSMAVELRSADDSTFGRVQQFVSSPLPRGVAVDGTIGLHFGGRLSRPADFNGDGWKDLVLCRYREIDDTLKMELWLCFGGPDADLRPDWVRLMRRPQSLYEVRAGFDFNGDGYDDILVRRWEFFGEGREYYYYDIYLGGSPMDTVPTLTWRDDEFEGKLLTELAALPDVNRDGYDDWVVYFYLTNDSLYWDEDGAYVFFGGEELNLEPDAELAGFVESEIQGEVIGGDFNGDGRGDIIIKNVYAHRGAGELRIYYGRNRWHPRPLHNVLWIGADAEGFRVSGGIGSVGDYNGDGSDDFATANFNSATIYPGYRNLNRVVEPVSPPSTPLLRFTAYPDPFNASLTVEIELAAAQGLQLEVLDLSGRRLVSLFQGSATAGVHRFPWRAEVSGVYFIHLQCGSQRRIEKVVCIR